MSRRPVTLFTGQWADMPIEELARKAGEWGYDGLELACWGDHFDVRQAVTDPGYVKRQRALLERHGLGVWAISNHLTGQAVCDVPLDHRHRDVLPPHVWGDVEPNFLLSRSSSEMYD
ncbi:sugar phosphate isomerase/epimerase, partial [Streptomyces sp. NPDC059627]